MAKRKVRGIRQPHAARLLYTKELYRVIEFVEGAISGTPMPRFDALPNAHDSFFNTIRKRLEDWMQRASLTMSLEGIAQKTEAMTEAGFQAQMLILLGGLPMVPAAKSQLRELFVQENMKLVGSMSESLLSKLETVFLRSMRQGSHVREIEKQLQAEIGLSKRRARLIARDQVNKYSGDLTKHHQKEAGITHYRWETSGDSRVRDRHDSLNGKTFAWAKPPISDKSGGRLHPRQGINCRCDAIPVLGEA